MRELNLLPPNRKQTLTSDTVTVASFGFLRVLLVSLGLLTGTGVFLLGGLISFSRLGADPGNQAAETIARYQALGEALAQEEQQLAYLETIGRERFAWSENATAFFQAAPAGVTIQSLDANLEQGEIVFSGTANARNTLIAYDQRLRSLPWVTAVIAPSSNLLQRDNPTFTFQLLTAAIAQPSPSPNVRDIFQR